MKPKGLYFTRRTSLKPIQRRLQVYIQRGQVILSQQNESWGVSSIQRVMRSHESGKRGEKSHYESEDTVGECYCMRTQPREGATALGDERKMKCKGKQKGRTVTYTQQYRVVEYLTSFPWYCPVP